MVASSSNLLILSKLTFKMANDRYWFRHDCRASSEIPMQKLRLIYGWEGVGLFWGIIELLRDQDGYKWDEKEVQLMAKMMDCELSKINTFIKDCERFEIFYIKNGYIFNAKLTENMKKWEVKKLNGNQGGRPKKKPNHNLNETEPITETKPNHNLTHNLNETIREQNRTEDNIKEQKDSPIRDKKIKEKKTIEDRTKDFKISIYPFSKSNGWSGIYDTNMLKKFFDYWSEPNTSKTKMRFEMEKTWDLGKRIARWANNNFEKDNIEKKPSNL